MLIRLRQTLRLFDCRFSRCSLHTRGNGGEAAARSLARGEYGSLHEIKRGTEPRVALQLRDNRVLKLAREPFRPISQFRARIGRPLVWEYLRRTRGGEEEGSVTKAPAYGESERMETASTVRSKKSHGVCYGHSGPSGRYPQITRSFA